MRDERPFEDVTAERSTVSGILKYGRNAFVDVDGLLTPSDYSVDINQVIFKCAQEFYAENYDGKLDTPSLESIANKLGLLHLISSRDAQEHIRALRNYPVDLASVRPQAAKIFRLNIARELDDETAKIRKQLRGITGDESINQIIAMVENPLFDYTARLNGGDEGPSHIAKGGREWLQNVIDNPCENIGIPTPFPIYNRRIGGGYRRKTVSIMAARPKSGKTIFTDNVALHVAGTLGIPVFNLDTEMTREEHLARILASLSGIDSFDIERGLVSRGQADVLMEKMEWLEGIPYTYESVIDASFDEQIASMRRWMIKDVGVDANGRSKDALIIYDYLQMTDAEEFKGDFKEYQMLGFMMLALLRLAKRCDVPILSMLQTNRDGIDKETTAVASGSDRIIWKCANFSVIKRKTQDEINEDGPDEGNTKFYNLIARHGPQIDPKNFINVKFDGAFARMTECRTRDEVYRDKNSGSQKGFVCEYDPDETFDMADGGSIRGYGDPEHDMRASVPEDRGVSRPPKRGSKKKR